MSRQSSEYRRTGRTFPQHRQESQDPILDAGLNCWDLELSITSHLPQVKDGSAQLPKFHLEGHQRVSLLMPESQEARIIQHFLLLLVFSFVTF